MKRYTNYTKPKIKPYKKIHNESYKQTLSAVRKHHNSGKNAFSRILHANGMDSLHEYLAFSLMHPKVLLTGSATALTGQIISVLMAEFYGYNYNYLLFIYFFVIGYILSIVYLTLTFKLRK